MSSDDTPVVTWGSTPRAGAGGLARTSPSGAWDRVSSKAEDSCLEKSSRAASASSMLMSPRRTSASV